jgi:molybdate transport system regulatory protein
MTRLVLQLHFDPENRLGPGKIELLRQIELTGSISAAGRAMNMSYRRAWLLVDAMRQTFQAPVVATRFGGAATGRAKLTPLGRELVQLYDEINQASRNACDNQITRLEQLLSDGRKRAPDPVCNEKVARNDSNHHQPGHEGRDRDRTSPVAQSHSAQ